MCTDPKPSRRRYSQPHHPATQRSRANSQLPPITSCRCVQKAWLASRAIPRRKGTYLMPGAQRPLNEANFKHAMTITRECALDLLKVLWGIHPYRTTLMFFLNILRGLSPAFRCYSQAMIVDELQSFITSDCFTWSRLVRLLVTEILRRAFDGFLDSFATTNERIVHDSARFFVEYQQVAQRLRLDIPTLADPHVRDCLQESDLFVRSFNGMGGFGLLSPFDFVQILALASELVSHIFVLLSLTGGTAHLGALLFSLFSAVLPMILDRYGLATSQADNSYSPQEAKTAERQEKLRSLAYSDVHRSEILVFGLGPWILSSWSAARRAMLTDERYSLTKSNLPDMLKEMNVSDLLFALQNIPLLLMFQSSSVSLGSLALYRSSVQSVVFTVGNLLTTIRMAFQGVFLMGAFCAAMNIQPRLDPPDEDALKYPTNSGGMKLEARHLSYTYPGSKDASLKDINFTLNAGESLAIVGYNGSGKSTLAKVLLRTIDFDTGELLVNGVDIRRLPPRDYHRRISTVFQGFSKFNSTVKENVGLGYVQKLSSHAAIERAIRLGGADSFVGSLPSGIKTKLDATGFDYPSCAGMNAMVPSGFSSASSNKIPHGLSGGEWQRIAVSRAFMRAERPEVDLLLFDEPTSSLDSHAQNKVFDTIDDVSRSSAGKRTKTVVFITHRLSTARRADKIAMMERGTITEFGSHEELLKRDGSYAALYRASV
ncbi:P-loop containing nucleoside triphosphate hydrolase protein [Coniophora puteana RWD-64-598 SS2]|uniref:P-loop containing nucleoside triphosphate hydrolase protein n=1 Tax=Coniophora puteana (strain RWD-64-598) TaxID=741705 RepID=A0A5M3MUQ9_CONPW|nr:P-loop containing nucleoside triphosphate hydrolase protein [Coniophora puteana RWD-64-598 SS2]EIW82494.1 P-loop containing nucleoside triphosphate hydrolase protein [Coniophora puteana RWD-64-598 SS2]